MTSKFGNKTPNTGEGSAAPNAGSASDILKKDAETIQSATQDEVNAALQAQANKITQGLGQVTDPTQTTGNVVSGMMSTTHSALNLLNSLDQSYDHESQRPASRPEGYYTVHKGFVRTGGKRVVAEVIGGLFFFDPKLLDEEAKASLDSMVKANMASYESGDVDGAKSAS